MHITNRADPEYAAIQYTSDAPVRGKVARAQENWSDLAGGLEDGTRIEGKTRGSVAIC